MYDLSPKRNVTIPEISDRKLNDRVDNIRVLVTDGNGKLKRFLPSKQVLRSPRNYAFLFDGRIPFFSRLPPELKIIYKYVCYHEYAYYGFFKASLAEVFAQMPDDIADKAYGFRISEGNTYCSLTPDEKYQWSVITVYGR